MKAFEILYDDGFEIARQVVAVGNTQTMEDAVKQFYENSGYKKKDIISVKFFINF